MGIKLLNFIIIIVRTLPVDLQLQFTITSLFQPNSRPLAQILLQRQVQHVCVTILKYLYLVHINTLKTRK